MRHLKEQLSQQEDFRRSATGLERQDSSAHAMQLINRLVDGINRNVAEGINYHKALFEVRDATGKNRRALQALTLKAQVGIPSMQSTMRTCIAPACFDASKHKQNRLYLKRAY